MERYHMFKLGLAILFYAAYCIRPMLVSGLRSSSLVTNQTLRPEDYNVFYQGVDGTPGVDFPVLSFIPRTTFSCSGIESGYYADLDTDCQVFHICEEGKKISFLCPNGTIFEQADLICEWWYKVNCTNAPSLYQESAEFLREDLARRKASRRIALDGRERNHGAVMRIEESASVSAQQNGKPLRISSRRGQVGVEYTRSTSSPSRSNLIQSAVGRDQNIPQKRYNDADTGNFINNDNRVDGGFEYSGPSSVSVEKQLYTRSTTPSSASNLGEIPSRKQLNKNRGSIKYGSNGFGSKITSTIGSTLKPTTDAYDLAFPTHRSEVTFNDFRPRPTSGSNTVKIDSSKVNLGQPKQKGTVALTRNGILNRRLEPTDSDELQVPQETAAFSSNSYNSLQSNTRKFTSSPYPNHRPTYSDLKRPDFSSTKLVNPINSVTPQYITTQSITSGKPFVGSTVGGNVFRGTGRTKQNEATFKPFSATERTPTVSTYQPYEGSKLGFSTGGAKENKDAIKPFPTIEGTPTVSTDDTFESSKLGFSTPQAGLAVTQQNQEGSGSISSTERGVLYTVKPFTSSPLHISDDNNLDSTTPQDETSKTQEKQESFGPSDGTVPYTVQHVFTATYNTDSNNQAITSTSQDHVSTTQQNEETDGSYSTTDRAVPYTVQPVVSSTYQSFQDNSQGFSSTPQPAVSSTYQYSQDNSLGVSSTRQPGLSSTSTPSVEGITTRPVDHATVYGSFSRGPTTATPPNGVEVKLRQNADKIRIQLSKSFGGQPPKHDSTVGPQLASDGFVRITAGLSQPVVGGASQANLRGSGRGTSPPLYSQGGKGITASAAGSGGAGIAASTVLPNTLSLSEGTTLNVDIPESTAKGASTLIPSHIAPEVRVNNVQSTTGTPGAIETQTGAAENLDTGVTIAENDIGIGNTASGSPVKFNIDLATGSTGKYFNNGNIGSVGKTTPIFSGTGSTDAPNVQISIGSGLSGSTTAQPSYDNTGSTLLTNVEGSTLVPGSLGYDINSESQPTNGGLRTPTSSIVSTRISDNALRGLVSGASGITATPNIAIGEDSNGYPSSSVRPNVYAESQPTNGGLRTPTSSIVSTRISGNALRGLVTGAPAITAIPNIATGEDSNIGYPSSSVRPNVYAESQPTNGGLRTPTSSIVSTRISDNALRGLVSGAPAITAIPNIATGEDSNTGYPSSSVRPNVYAESQPTNGGLRTPTSSIVSTRISGNALRGLVTGAPAITAIPNIATGEDSNTGYPSSSVSPNVYAESQPTNGGLRTPTSSIVSTRISGNALRGLVTGAPAITAIPNIATGEDSNTGYPSSSVSPNVYAESQPTNGGLRIPTSNIVSTRISGKVIEGLVAGASGITAIPNIALSNSTGEDSNTGYPSSSVRPNVYISEKSKNTVSLPVGSGYDYSTVSSVTNGAHSQVTELLPIPETPRGSLQTINGTNSHSNSFRPNFYPTREGGNNVGKPTGSQVSTVEGNTYQSPPNSIKTFASDIQGTVPSSLRTQSVEINLSQNDIGSTLSPTEESSTYRSTSTQQSNDYNSFKSSSRPGESDVTGTGFYVTRNSFTSTTPAPFGLSQATTSSYSDSTPLVNVSPNSGEEVTPRAPALDTLSRSETRYPRPFQKSPNSIDDESSAIKFDAVTPTYFSYKISSARPFELPKDKVTPSPTIPTPFTTARSVQENVDDMINTLKEVIETQDYSSETPRPGLVVPPSAGPQTLHTLAQYFANALDGIVAEREKETGEELDPESKEKLTSLLTQMTMYRYNELFNRTGISADEGESTTATPIEEELEEGDSNNLVETPELRDLAKNFSLALAGYLNDPVAFRNELKTFRPTEPTTQSDEMSEIGVGDEELLNFSDADSKTSFKPSFPTPQAPAPTWGYIVAPKSSEDLDVKNSLNPDLHTADSQSFVPGFNNLAANTGKSIDKGVGSQRDVPGDHWTASPGVTKLWQSALSVNPSILNENLDSTRPISHFTEPYVPGTTPTPLHFPQSEIQYDLRALPKLTLNSTQVHGILIDFVNTTKPDDSNRLQRLLKKLNTTEDEFLHRMKEIESNPLTKRLILLLISECGANVTKDLEADPIHSLSELLNSPSSDPEVVGHQESRNSDIPELVDPSLQQDDQDTRALQLLNSLYAIASKFGK